MGSNVSKNCKQQHEEVHIENVPTTPVLTPESKKKLSELDPRSPSTYLSRTPLQLLSAAAEKLEELKENEKCLLDSDSSVKGKTILLGIDPRSPTTEFQRTPIVINLIDESELPKKIRNKNLDKVKQSAIIHTPRSTWDETLNVIPPKLLESSPVRPRSDINKRKSFVGLLETNIDFTETDLDIVLQQKCKMQDKMSTSADKVSVAAVDNENDAHSPTNELFQTPIQINKKLSEDNDIESNKRVEEPEQVVVELLDEDLIEVEKTVQEICEVIEMENEKIAFDNDGLPSDEDVLRSEEVDEIVMSNAVIDQLDIPTETKSAPVTPPTCTDKEQKSILFLSPIKKQIKSAPVTPPVVNITADVNELDKKLTNLIYQDEDIVVCPRIVKIKEHSNRSPLKSCNAVEPEKRKSGQKLRVSDRPRKSDYVVSKIPVFKEKGKGPIQCENTPPKNMEKRKVKVRRSQWDNADKTLII